MNLTQAEEILSKIKYKPGFYVRLRHNDRMYCTDIICSYTTYDTDKPKIQVPICYSGVITHEHLEKMSDTDLLAQIYNTILETEIHEAREWFKYKGVKIYDPHKDEREAGE